MLHVSARKYRSPPVTGCTPGPDPNTCRSKSKLWVPMVVVWIGPADTTPHASTINAKTGFTPIPPVVTYQETGSRSIVLSDKILDSLSMNHLKTLIREIPDFPK